MKTQKESKVEIRTLLLTHLWCSDRRRSRPPSSHRWAPSRLEDRRRRSGTGRGARTRSPSSSGPPKEERGTSVLGNLLRVWHPIDSRSRPINNVWGHREGSTQIQEIRDCDMNILCLPAIKGDQSRCWCRLLPYCTTCLTEKETGMATNATSTYYTATYLRCAPFIPSKRRREREKRT